MAILVLLLIQWTGQAARPSPCNRSLLNAGVLRAFRGGDGFHEMRNGGTWIWNGNRMVYMDRDGTLVSGLASNSASHEEILRRQLGPDRYNRILEARGRDRENVRTAQVQDLIRITDEGSASLDPDEVLAEVEGFGPRAPLSTEVEGKVLRVLRDMGRLGRPLMDWLEPKWRNGTLNQIPGHLMDDPIERRIRPEVLVYKAILARVYLSEEHSLIVSSGLSSAADSLHEFPRAALLMVVPRQRVREMLPGYLVITSYDGTTFGRGRIEFVSKGSKQVLAEENFNFTPH